MSVKHTRRSLRFECLRDTVDEAKRLNETPHELAGKWDLAKQCQHLSKTLRMSLEGAPLHLPFFIQPIARWILFSSIIKGIPTRLPLKTLPHFLPNESADTQESIDEYEILVEKVMDPNAPLLRKHPIFGRVTCEQWRQFHTWHAAHHFSHLIPTLS